MLTAVGDYNSDGKSDLLFRNTNGSLATWNLNDTAIIGGGTIGNPGSSFTPQGLHRRLARHPRIDLPQHQRDLSPPARG